MRDVSTPATPWRLSLTPTPTPHDISLSEVQISLTVSEKLTCRRVTERCMLMRSQATCSVSELLRKARAARQSHAAFLKQA